MDALWPTIISRRSRPYIWFFNLCISRLYINSDYKTHILGQNPQGKQIIGAAIDMVNAVSTTMDSLDNIMTKLRIEEMTTLKMQLDMQQQSIEDEQRELYDLVFRIDVPFTPENNSNMRAKPFLRKIRVETYDDIETKTASINAKLVAFAEATNTFIDNINEWHHRQRGASRRRRKRRALSRKRFHRK